MTPWRDGRSRLSERIADELQTEILRGGLVPNLRLPTEVELMERYSVSRTVVREAAKLLEQRGLVSVAPGRGMVVAAFDGARIAEQFSILMLASDGTFGDLLELRLALELQVTTAAAASATTDDLDRLAASISEGSAAIGEDGSVDAEAFLDADMNFHELLAQASGNPFFDLVCRPINSFLRSYYQHRDGYPSNPSLTLREHEEILQNLRRRDTYATRKAAEEHLRRLQRKWRPPTDGASPPSIREMSSTNDAEAAQRRQTTYTHVQEA
ncbi:FadR/GntR family transcriptional regulator [uncultured Friedmanniella sp.]|uniref:FadR/GntR family transcriptional regulator n=1 Tax=uncultured Friedmanniella sp. TaxID=335381 RepID=UPI0035CB1FA2